MLFKKGQKNYLAKLKIKFKASFTEALWIDNIFLFLNKHFLTNDLLPFLIQINNKPIGFFLVPPLWTSTTVIYTDIPVLVILFKFFTIDKQVS